MDTLKLMVWIVSSMVRIVRIFNRMVTGILRTVTSPFGSNVILYFMGGKKGIGIV